MAHGIGAERSFGLRPFAEGFVRRGLAVLVFDYRHFGESSGVPRCLVSPPRQRADYRAALRFVRERPGLDEDRIGLWGTSFSAGHVLVVAAGAPAGIRAVVAQVPFVSGISSTLAYPLRYRVPAVALAVADRVRGWLGLEPLTVPVVRRDGLALLASPDAHDGYLSLVPGGSDWPGHVPARVFLSVMAYRPLGAARRVRAPTLIVATRDDAVTPVGPVRRAARRIPECRYEEWPIGHFDIYHGEWLDRAVEMEGAFLEERLRR